MTLGEMDKRNRGIVKRIDAGESWKRIAQEYGLSKSRLGQILLRYRGQVAEPDPLSAEEKCGSSCSPPTGSAFERLRD